ncbi:MAG: hypothetical protein IJ036_03820 [Lachnospiraceae bacterium]|nr:hypothetical protein [Lachnospiraceae bacterium]
MKWLCKNMRTGLLMGVMVVLLSSVLFLTGCRRREQDPEENSGATQNQNQQDQQNHQEGYRTGLAIHTSMGNSVDAGDTEGIAQVDLLAMAVLLDEEGRIVDCSLDMLEAPMYFSATGQVTSSLDQAFQTKKELGDDYGMRAASGIGKEWYEQVEAFERYVQGKTIEEVEGIALTETTAPAEEELSASVTIKIGEYIDILVRAAENAQVIGSGAGDRIGLGIQTHMRNSKDAADGEDGSCQAYAYYAAVTTNGDGVVTGCIVDSTQTDVTFDEKGQLTVEDLNESSVSKKELGSDYGMKAASGIGKEWYEQAEAFEEYINGKTLEEIKGIAVDENLRPSEEELSASVTIAIGDFQSVIEKAFARIKAK